MKAVPRRSKVAGGALGVVICLWVVDSMWGNGTPDSASASSAPTVTPSPVSEPTDLAEPLRPLAPPSVLNADLELDWLRRDLFVATTVMEAAYPSTDAGPGDDTEAERNRQAALPFEQRHELQGVLTGRNPFAVIDGSLVSPGAEVDGFVLIEIHRDHVVFQRDGSRVLLSVRPPSH